MRMKSIAIGTKNLIQNLKKPYPTNLCVPSISTSSLTLSVPMPQPTNNDITKAPNGINTPSAMKSKKSNQQSLNEPIMPRLFWNGTHIPFEPRPSAATIEANAKIIKQITAVALILLGALPLAAQMSTYVVASTSVREIADDIAAMSTQR